MEVKQQRKSRPIAARLRADVVARLMVCSVFLAATVEERVLQSSIYAFCLF
jgi:hypothetical protein